MIGMDGLTAEIAVGDLARIYENRDGYRGSDAAKELEELYCRMIYTDRGPEPTDEEIGAVFDKYAAGLEWRGLSWK